jgi:hypothetical protein
MNALMTEAANTSETLANFYQTTRCYNTEDSHLQTYYIPMVGDRIPAVTGFFSRE